MMKSDDLDYLFRFIGYGNPFSHLWFIGIEEGGTPGRICRESHRDYMLGNEIVRYDSGVPQNEGRRNRVWSTVSDIVEACGTASHAESYFMGNIAPVARPTVRNPHEGIDAASYALRVKNERVPRLIRAKREAPGRAIVFHGAVGWSTYQVIEAFGPDAGIGRDPATGLFISHSMRLIFAPTFSWGSRHFGKARREKVVDLLHQWRGH